MGWCIDARDILETKQTILFMNGYVHGDDMKIINQIPYFTINSTSYIWHGMKARRVYPEDRGISPKNIEIANRKWNGISIEPKISNWESNKYSNFNL